MKKQTDLKVYFIADRKAGAFKIGITKNVNKRLQELQTSSPNKLEVIEVIENATHYTEQMLHERFKSSRLKGEWFRLYDTGDEILIQGKYGNVACLIFDVDSNGDFKWTTKWNLRPEETCFIAEIDTGGNVMWCNNAEG